MPEVLVLILNLPDTKTNKLSPLPQTGLKNYGHRERDAITTANFGHQSYPPPPPLPLPLPPIFIF